MAANRWGQAKREVTALKPLIVQRLESGSTLRQIWMGLRAEGKISIAQCNFYLQVGKLLAPQPVEVTPAPGSAGGALPLFRRADTSTSTSNRTVTVSSAPTIAPSPEDVITRQFGHSNRPCEAELLGD